MASPTHDLFRKYGDEPTELLAEIPSDAHIKMVFASSNDDVFLSFGGDETMFLKRYTPSSNQWNNVLKFESWRMTEDDQGAIYAGNYHRKRKPPAQICKSVDNGLTWQLVFADEGNHHIHTIRFDENAQTLWAATGDGATRGQYFSTDYGHTFHRHDVGEYQGHTDVAFTTGYIFWASDDGSGLIYRQDRAFENTRKIKLVCNQYIWFVVAEENQVYVGTMPKKAGQQGMLFASSDEGEHFNKVFQTDRSSSNPYDSGLFGDSRALTSSGWLYFSTVEQSYRIRAAK